VKGNPRKFETNAFGKRKETLWNMEAFSLENGWKPYGI